MKAPVVIRVAAIEDLEGVLLLERAVEEAPHWTSAEYQATIGPNSKQGTVRRCLVVAEMGGELSGFAVGKVVSAAGVGELESIAVRVSARRMGVGMRLCQEVSEWCWGQGATRMELEVRARSVGARGLYERLGFVVEGVRRGYYKEPVDDAVLMRLDLKNCG